MLSPNALCRVGTVGAAGPTRERDVPPEGAGTPAITRGASLEPGPGVAPAQEGMNGGNYRGITDTLVWFIAILY